MEPSKDSPAEMSAPKPERQVFPPVPVGQRVRWMVRLVCCVVALFVLLHLGLLVMLPSTADIPAVWIALGLAPLLVFLVWYGSRIRYYLIEGDTLVIDRAFFPVRIPMERYSLVHAFEGAVGDVEKIIGNDGLGVISGHFKSAEHGPLRIYASDLHYSVMLEGAKEKLIVSPTDHPAFIEAVLHHLYTRPGSPKL